MNRYFDIVLLSSSTSASWAWLSSKMPEDAETNVHLDRNWNRFDGVDVVKTQRSDNQNFTCTC